MRVADVVSVDETVSSSGAATASMTCSNDCVPFVGTAGGTVKVIAAFQFDENGGTTLVVTAYQVETY